MNAETTGLVAFYCFCVLAASLAGGWIPLWVRLTHTRMQVATSFVAGLMLGVGVLHLLPHAWHELRSIDQTVRWMLGGFVVMFFVQRFFHFHHHDVPDESPEVEPGHFHSGHGHGVVSAGGGEGGCGCEPGEAVHEATLAERSASHLSWTGAAVGLTLHTVLDGVAIAASVAADAHSGAGGGLAGLSTFLVVLLHKPFDALAIGALMAAAGGSRSSRHLVNTLFALAVPAGILLFHAGVSGGGDHHFLGLCLAFTAGTFLCIASSDLLPELQFHAHDRGKLSVALLSGLGLAALIGLFETGGHDHPLAGGGESEGVAPAVEAHDHAHP